MDRMDVLYLRQLDGKMDLAAPSCPLLLRIHSTVKAALRMRDGIALQDGQAGRQTGTPARALRDLDILRERQSDLDTGV